MERDALAMDLIAVSEAEQVEDANNIEPTRISLDNTQILIEKLTIKNASVLTLEQERRLAEAAHRGDEQARTTLVEHNIRLVIYLARRYTWVKGMDLADIISEGNLGLLHAIDKYNGELGYRFSTYAGWWIRQYIERSIMDKARMVRIPVYLLQERRKYSKTLNVLQTKLKREPTEQEIADLAGKDLAWVKEMSEIDQGSELSLDNLVNEDSTFLDGLADLQQNSPEEQACQDSMIRLVDGLLHTLPPIQCQILALRFGLMGNDPHTVEETARILQSSVSDVKRKQAAAIHTLRSSIDIAELES